MSASDVKVLVGYDGSDDGMAALTFAATEAVAREGMLRIVYAVDDTVLNSAWGIVFDVDAVRREGLELLAQAGEIAHGLGVPLEDILTECVVGQPAAVLSRLSEAASVVVVGRRAESGTHSMFVGSTAVGLVGTAGCPVIMVSALNRADAPQRVIGVGLDPVAHGLVAVEWAMKRAKRLGDRVHVVSVVKKPQGRFFGGTVSEEQRLRAIEDVRQKVQAAVDGLTAEIPGVPVTVDVRFGSPIDELVSMSEELDLLIVGVHPTFPTYSLGGVVRGLMAHSGCTLGLIRHG
ncbi:MAG TPA: universal stress protein [Propioniciclava tarda]|nr:universal stress protein [Propioniciclava tarda]